MKKWRGNILHLTSVGSWPLSRLLHDISRSKNRPRRSTKHDILDQASLAPNGIQSEIIIVDYRNQTPNRNTTKENYQPAQGVEEGSLPREYTVDYIVQHVCNSREQKLDVLWYGCTSRDDMIKPHKPIPRQFITQCSRNVKNGNNAT